MLLSAMGGAGRDADYLAEVDMLEGPPMPRPRGAIEVRNDGGVPNFGRRTKRKAQAERKRKRKARRAGQGRGRR